MLWIPLCGPLCSKLIRDMERYNKKAQRTAPMDERGMGPAVKTPINGRYKAKKTQLKAPHKKRRATSPLFLPANNRFTRRGWCHGPSAAYTLFLGCFFKHRGKNHEENTTTPSFFPLRRRGRFFFHFIQFFKNISAQRARHHPATAPMLHNN